MKKSALLFVLVPVTFVILISGCTTQDPVQVIRDSVARMESLESYEAEYEYSVSMPALGEMEGDLRVYKRGEIMRTDMDIPFMLGMVITVSNYYLPEGTYSCSLFAENVTCIEGGAEDMPISDPGQTLEAVISLIEKGIVDVKLNGIGKVAGRDCYNMTSNVDISRLSEASENDLAAMGLNSSMVGELENVKSMGIFDCYDVETGMSLDNTIIMVVDMEKQTGMEGLGDMEMMIRLNAISYEPNKSIPDSVFELPAEPMSEEEYYEQLYEEFGDDLNETNGNESFDYEIGMELEGLEF